MCRFAPHATAPSPCPRGALLETPETCESCRAAPAAQRNPDVDRAQRTCPTAVASQERTPRLQANRRRRLHEGSRCALLGPWAAAIEQRCGRDSAHFGQTPHFLELLRRDAAAAGRKGFE